MKRGIYYDTSATMIFRFGITAQKLSPHDVLEKSVELAETGSKLLPRFLPRLSNLSLLGAFSVSSTPPNHHRQPPHLLMIISTIPSPHHIMDSHLKPLGGIQTQHATRKLGCRSSSSGMLLERSETALTSQPAEMNRSLLSDLEEVSTSCTNLRPILLTSFTKQPNEIVQVKIRRQHQERGN